MKATMLSHVACTALLLAVTSQASASAQHAVLLTGLQSTASAEALTAQNPLLGDWDTPYEAPPFHLIEEAHFLPAFDAALASHQAEIQAIANNPEAPSFENTLLAMEVAGQDLSRVSSVFFNLASSASNDEIRAIQREMSPRLAAHSASITLNPALFARIDTLYQQRDTLALEPQQLRVLERSIRPLPQLHLSQLF